MNRAIILIPVYKETLKSDEVLSFNQCLSILSKHDISLLCPEEMDTSNYQSLANSKGRELKEIRFPRKNFESIDAYNRLLLSKSFYTVFDSYDYMLLYQLDAFVFRDDLHYWIEQEYDYIGAPFNLDGSSGLKENSKMLLTGNGGFSLRKIDTFINLFDIKGNALSAKGIAKINANSPWWKVFPLIILSKFGFRNTIKYFSTEYKHNEDVFYSCLKYQDKVRFRIPDFQESTHFAWEQDAPLFYEQNKKLPFGCHAWRAYSYDEFWKPFIVLKDE